VSIAKTTIRRAVAADIPALVALVRDYWDFEHIDGFDEQRTRAVLGTFLANPVLGCGWIAEHSGKAVGYLLACYVFSLEHGGMTAEIDEFFVLASHRGSGLGRRMLTTAEKTFTEAGCTNVALQLGRGNDAARAFYRRAGYGERDGYELMDKMLAPKPVVQASDSIG